MSSTTLALPRPVDRAVEPPTPARLRRARRIVARHLSPTPMIASPEIDPGVLLKVETGQPTGSFKVRGALAALAALEPGTAVVAASAGNHALGVAHAAGALGLEATVVVPRTAAPAKVAALARLPVRLVLHGADYDQAEAHALSLAGPDRRFVSPYNDPDVIAGQATIADEILADLDGPLTLVAPVGGGGLAAGLALAAARSGRARVVGVEGEGSPSVRAALDAGRLVRIAHRPTVADGLGANLEPGCVTVEILRSLAEDVLVVPEAEILDAIRFLHDAHGLVVEGAGAVAVAAVLAGRVPTRGRVVALVTGRNIDPGRHAAILDRRRMSA